MVTASRELVPILPLAAKAEQVITVLSPMYVLSNTFPVFTQILIANQDFGGLTMVVRFEVDACLPFHPILSHHDTPPTLTTNKPTLRFPHVAIIRAGSRVPQSHLIELKTYSKAAGKSWSKSYPQLYLSQTPHIYYGNHKGGKFSEIKKFT